MPLLEDALQPARGNHTSHRPMTLGMITNPLSGGNRKGIQGFGAFPAKNNKMHHGLAVTPADVNTLLADFCERGVELLIVNGGDGTVQAVLTALYGRSHFPIPPVLALLRAGTASMLARDVGVRGKPSAALAKIHAWNVDAGRSDRAILERPILKVSQEGRSKPVCGMFFGAGAILQGIDLCHGSMNPRGVRGEIMPGLIMARLVSAFLAGNGKLLPPTEMQIGLDERETGRQRYLFALVTTLERLFLGLSPFWGEEHASLHFTAVKSNPAHLLRNLPFLLCGRRTAKSSPKNGFFSHNVERVRLDFRGRFTLDGEIFEAGAPLTVEPAGPARFLHI